MLQRHFVVVDGGLIKIGLEPDIFVFVLQQDAVIGRIERNLALENLGQVAQRNHQAACWGNRQRMGELHRLPIDLQTGLGQIAQNGGKAHQFVYSGFGDRRQVLWEVRGFLRARHGSKGKRGQHTDQLTLDMQAIPTPPPLSALQRHELLRWDFETHNQTAGPHPLTLHRYELSKLGILSTASLKQHKGGTIVRVAGSVISRQRPPTAKGMCFIILEDETGYVPTAIVPQVYEQFSRVLRAPQLVVEGKLEDSGKLAGNSYRSILIQRLWSKDLKYENACGTLGFLQ